MSSLCQHTLDTQGLDTQLGRGSVVQWLGVLALHSDLPDPLLIPAVNLSNF
jgi:hypothetical protein